MFNVCLISDIDTALLNDKKKFTEYYKIIP